MELRHPIYIMVTLIILISYLAFFKKEKKKDNKGPKIANTKDIQKTKYYQQKLKKYKIIIKIIQSISLLGIFTCSILIARPNKIDTLEKNEWNRDIYLCMDVSTSVDELNKELTENLKNTLNHLNKDRLGISIFNTSSVILTPLTEDYDYVEKILNKIQKSIEINTSPFGYQEKDFLSIKNYIISGTLEGNNIKGSSLIGDGLASCMYNFSNLEEKRSRIIILSTDNDLAGSPLLTLEEGADLCKEKEIIVFGIGTKNMKEENRLEMKQAVEKTGGKFYEHSKENVSTIINDIEKTSKSLLKNKKEQTKIDIPEIPFIILIISISLLIFLNKLVTT